MSSDKKVRTPQDSPLLTFVYAKGDPRLKSSFTTTTARPPLGEFLKTAPPSSSLPHTTVFRTSSSQPFSEFIPYEIDYSNGPCHAPIPTEYMCDVNLMTEPLDQASCGSCWAFASVAALSDRMNFANRRRVMDRSLSPVIPLTCNFFLDKDQHRIFEKDYVKTILNLRNILDNLACHGNSVVMTAFFLHVWGTYTSTCAPYKSELVRNLQYNRTNFGFRSTLAISSKVNFTTDFSSTSCAMYFGNVGRTLNVSNCLGRIVNKKRIYMRPAQIFRCLFYYSIRDAVANPAHIQKDIMLWGPVVTSFRVYEDFYTFDPTKDGVYVSKEDPNAIVGGHAVCIVGWGEYFDQKSSNMIPFWWIKNSWGTSYGQNGYFRMLRGRNHCGIEENVIGMMPHCFPESETQLDDVMRVYIDHWKVRKTVTPDYVNMLRTVLQFYTNLPEDVTSKLYNDALLAKYPLVDYYFFHSPFRMNFQITPGTGYSHFNELEFPGLDFSPPYTVRTMRHLKQRVR